MIFIIVAIFVFILGLIVGSFLNVVILRYNTGMGIAVERSHCFSCGRKLRPLELIPVLSFIIQRGKCKGCGAKISWQYPLVELATGLLFLALFFHLPFNQLIPGVIGGQIPLSVFLYYIYILIYWLVMWSILVVITVYDLRHKIIPDGLVYTFIALGLSYSLIVDAMIGSFSPIQWWNLAGGPIFFVVFFLIWWLSRGRAMGFGDAKLVLGLGFFIGIVAGTSAIIFAFWIGAIVGVILIFLPSLMKSRMMKAVSRFFRRFLPKGRLFGAVKGLTIRSELPFAPFLILGTLIEFFYHFDLLHLALFISH